MGPNECRPCGRVLALGCWRQSVALQDIAHRLIGNLVPQIGQCPHNSVIAPVRVLLGHANDQLLKSSVDPGSAWGSPHLRATELAGDQLAVPCQDGVWPGHSCHLAEDPAAQSMTNLTEPGSLGVRETRPPLQIGLLVPAFG